MPMFFVVFQQQILQQQQQPMMLQQQQRRAMQQAVQFGASGQQYPTSGALADIGQSQQFIRGNAPPPPPYNVP